MIKAIMKRDKKGQTLVEYALIVALISVLLIAALQALKTGASDTFGAAKSALDTAS